MTSPLALALLGGAIAGAGAASVAVLVLAPTSKDRAAIQKDTSEDWRVDVASLRAENQTLQHRIEEMEDRLAFAESVRSSPTAVDLQDPEMLAAAVKEAVAGMQSATPQTTAPVYVPDVEAALKVVRDREEQDRELRRQEAMNDRLEERLTDLTGKLGLAPNQVDSLRTTVQGFYSKTAALFQDARASGDFGNMRDQMRQYRDDAQQSIQAALSPTQWQQYEESDSSLLGFGRGDFGGGPPGDFGGGFGGGNSRGGRGGRGGG